MAQRAWAALIGRHPDWEPYLGTRGDGNLEAAVPAPPGSRAGHLIAFSDAGEHLWVRFSPPTMCYGVDSEDEMLSVIEDILSERTAFVTTWRGAKWTGTTLIATGEYPVVDPGEVAVVVSWTGAYDMIVPEDAEGPGWN